MGNREDISILEKEKNGILIIDNNKKVIYANKSLRKLLGNDINQLLGDYLNCGNTIKEKENCQNTSKCSLCKINSAINNVMLTKNKQRLNNIQVIKNNVKAEVAIEISTFEKDCLLLEVFYSDIKNEQMNFLYRLAEKSKDIIFFKNEKRQYFYVNKTYADFLNRDKDYLIGKTDKDLLNEKIMSAELYEQCVIGDNETLEKGFYNGVEAIGDMYFRVSKESIDGGILGTARDITTEINAINKSETDQLTGMYNRFKLDNEINDIYSNPENQYYMALIDLDNLRTLNNKYGHIKGDNYLKVLGNILKTQKQGMFFRIGGDEFVGLIKCDGRCPSILFNKVFEEIEILNLQPKLSISVGVSKLDLSKSFVENYEITDKILYSVKASGKNQCFINDEKN